MLRLATVWILRQSSVLYPTLIVPVDKLCKHTVDRFDKQWSEVTPAPVIEIPMQEGGGVKVWRYAS